MDLRVFSQPLRFLYFDRNHVMYSFMDQFNFSPSPFRNRPREQLCFELEIALLIAEQVGT